MKCCDNCEHLTKKQECRLILNVFYNNIYDLSQIKWSCLRIKNPSTFYCANHIDKKLTSNEKLIELTKDFCRQVLVITEGE